MNYNILVTIVVPVYNVENYIQRCLESIINQSYKNIEIIVINDGSTDRSGIICDTFAKKDKRITVIHKQNGGLSDARNVGIDNAKGDYICFIDSDDFIKDTYIEKLLFTCIKYKADICICKYETGISDIFSKLQNNHTEIIQELSNIESLEYLYKKSLLGLFDVAWNKLYSTKLFDNIRYPIGKVHEDVFITYKLLFKSQKVLFINDCLYYYYQSPKSIQRGDFNVKRFDLFDGLEERMIFFKKNNLNGLYNETLIYYFHMLLYFRDIITSKKITNLKLYLKLIDSKIKFILKPVLFFARSNFKIKIFLILFYIYPELGYKIRNIWMKMK